MRLLLTQLYWDKSSTKEKKKKRTENRAKGLDEEIVTYFQDRKSTRLNSSHRR